MKKAIITLITVAALLLCGVTAYAIQGLDSSKSTKILANDGYATITASAQGGKVITSKSVLQSASAVGGLHVTDNRAVISMDKAFLDSLVANLKTDEVTMAFGYNSGGTELKFSITDANGSAVFGSEGRCLGEFPYTAGSSVDSDLLYVAKDGKPIGVSAYYPDAKLVRFELLGSGTFSVKQGSVPFTDISSHWGKNYAEYLYSRGLASGTSAKTFSPNGTLTRAQFVMFLAYISMEDISGCNSNKFTDVKSGKWYYHAVSWAVNAGITSGTSATTFSPDANVTREQMARLTVTFLQYKGVDLTAIKTADVFKDSSKISNWAKTTVNSCQTLGIINGKDGKVFDPLGNATRAEAATVCSRIVSYYLIMPQ